MTNDVEMPSSDFEGSNADLYAMDLPLSLAGALAAHQATAHSTNVSSSTESENSELHATPEPPPSPPFSKPASWNAIDAATAERQANMQQEIAAQELRDLKRCLDLRDYDNRTAYEKIHDSEPLVVPKPWSMSGVPLKTWVKHPYLLEEYLEGEQFSREAIRVRREYLEIVDCGSPEIECLAALEKHVMEIRASRLLADVLLEAILHATQKLILEIEDGDKTKKKPVSDLCRRLMAHATHTENNSELIRAVEAISEMERRHMPWRFDAALESRTENPPTSSAAAPLDSPPADDICLSQEQTSLPPPDEKSLPKDLRRLSVKFQENLQLLSPGQWRMPGKSQSKPSPRSHKPLSSQSSRGRSHHRATDIGHLTHPIVMMARDPPSVASRPTDVNHATHTIIRPAASRQAPIGPQAILSPESLVANTGKKRRASQELTATSDCETNPNKRPNRSERDGNVHSTQVESRDTNVEIGNTARPVCPTPSPQMQAALAEACRKRDERRLNERKHLSDDESLREKYWRRSEGSDNEAYTEHFGS